MFRRILALLVVFGGVAAVAAFLTGTADASVRSAQAAGSQPHRWANWVRQQADWLTVPDASQQ